LVFGFSEGWDKTKRNGEVGHFFFMTQRGATFFNVPNVFWGLYLYKGGATIIDL